MMFRLLTILCILAVLFTTCKKSAITYTYEDISLPSPMSVKGIVFTNSMNGYAVGGKNHQEGFLYKTEDGGASWMLKLDVSAFLETLYDVIFPSSSISIAGSDYLHFFKSNDNWESSVGTVWEPWMLPALLPVRRFYQINDSILVFAGGTRYFNGMYAVSRDTGRTWKHDTLSHEMRGISFANDLVGYISGHGIVLKTIDGGHSFDTLQLADDFFISISALTENHVVIASNQGKILKSVDGGATWDNVYNKAFLGNSKNINDMTFADQHEGYAVGNYGLALKTTDGGNSWTRIEGLPDVIFRRVIVTEEGKVLISGDQGTIIRLD